MYLIGFGASSMAGVGDAYGGFFRRLEDALGAARPELQFLNLGVSGNTTRDMLGRASAVPQTGGHDLIVLLGCNDVPRVNDATPHVRTTLGEYERNLCSLLPRIQGEFSLFVSSFPVCAARTGVSEEMLASYMEAAMTIAQDCGYEVWDLFRELQGSDIARY